MSEERPPIKQEIIVINGESYLVPSDEAIKSIHRYEDAHAPHVIEYVDPSVDELKFIIEATKTHTGEGYHSLVHFNQVYDDPEREQLVEKLLEIDDSTDNCGVYIFVSSNRVYHDQPEKRKELKELEEHLTKLYALREIN